METFTDALAELRRMKARQLVLQVVNLGLIVSSAWMIWMTCVVVTNSETPIVVVLSESMEPTYQRGDLMLLALWERPIRIGDVIVYKVGRHPIPIVHRVITVHEKPDGSQELLTKGDHNPGHDRMLYGVGQLWVSDADVVGRVVGVLPHLGYVTLVMTDYPIVKYVVIGGMAFFAIAFRESS